MKISLNKIQVKLKSVASFKKINPHNHWRVLLRIFFVIVIILVLFSFYILYKIKNKQVFQIKTNSTDQALLINEKLLEKVTESFTHKSIKEKEIKDGSKKYKDPSIN